MQLERFAVIKHESVYAIAAGFHDEIVERSTYGSVGAFAGSWEYRAEAEIKPRATDSRDVRIRFLRE